MQPLYTKFRTHWKSYVFQSLAATVSVFLVLLVLSLQYQVVIASIGATAFIVFALPKEHTAQARNVLGGHLLGLLSGSLLAFVPHNTEWAAVAVYASAVGLSMFLMVITDTEHPPAAGTALGVVITGFVLEAVVVVVVFAGLLALIHRVFRRHLRNLF
jgi:CBS-domain-containing membrane protein